MNRLLFDHDKTVTEWVGKNLDCDFKNVLAAVGTLNQDGTLVGGAVLHDLTKYDVELSYFGRNTLTPDMVKALAYIVFIHAKLNRLSLCIARKKRKLRVSVVNKFRFSYEGIRRRLYGKNKGDDGILYGLLKEEASRYLRTFDGQRSRVA